MSAWPAAKCQETEKFELQLKCVGVAAATPQVQALIWSELSVWILMDSSKEMNLFTLQMRNLPHRDDNRKVKGPVLRQQHGPGT